MTKKVPSVKTNLKTQAYTILKEKLINCVYPSGSILNEAQLAAELGFSRTPIREALSLLETEGYVVIAPKKGIFVTDISLNDVLQIFQVRMEIEPITLKLASSNLPMDELIQWKNTFQNFPPDIQNGFKVDTAMHLFIIEHCGNQYIIDMMHQVFDKNMRIIISSKQNQAHIEDAHNEHLEIINALIEQRFEDAAALMHTHIAHCRTSAIDFFYTL